MENYYETLKIYENSEVDTKSYKFIQNKTTKLCIFCLIKLLEHLLFVAAAHSVLSLLSGHSSETGKHKKKRETKKTKFFLSTTENIGSISW